MISLYNINFNVTGKLKMEKFKFAFAVLDKALTTKRPHKHVSTVKFCKWLQDRLKGSFTDDFGNIHVDLRDEDARTLFVAHVDTVHRSGGKNKVEKTATHWKASGSQLGADDGAGVALLAHMVREEVPGYYIFTQGEECGGLGAKWLADNMADLLRQFDRAIAFDRRGTYSVITHQGYGRCCSDDFAEALSAEFNRNENLLFMPDNGGIYTDTAEFTHLIPECTNISIGYELEHSASESLLLEHFREMCSSVTKIKWDSLPTKRDTTAVESDWFAYDKVPFDAAKYHDFPTAEFDNEFIDALDLAFDDQPNKLIELIAQTANPENASQAMKLIDKRKITEQFLDDIDRDSACVDMDTLLMMAFDQLTSEAYA